MVTIPILPGRLPKKLRPINDEQNANAAVALLLKLKGESFEILLVKRAKQPSDPWSGQMALPGGKQELQDKDLKATVTRETLEETSLNISKSRFLGVLSAVDSIPRHGMLILPYVVELEGEPRAKLNSCQLDAYRWVPYEKLVNNRGKIMQPGYGEIPAYLLKDAIAWGIAYHILSEFSRAVEAATKQ